MPISQSDLFNLYKTGKISEQVYNQISPPQKMSDGGLIQSKEPEAIAEPGQEYNPKITDVNETLGLPQGQPVIASNSSSGSNSPGFFERLNPLRAVTGAVQDSANITSTVADTIGKRATETTSQGINQTTSRNTLADQQQKALFEKGREGQGAIERIAEETGIQTKPITELSEKDLIQQKQAIESAKIQQQKDLIQANDLREAASSKIFTDMYQKAVVDPEQYSKQLGIGGKISTSIGMVLSGIGSGLTGQPNMAMQVYQKNVDRNIQAQKDNIANDFKKLANIMGVSQAYVDSASMRGTIANLATMTTIAGTNALLESTMQKVKANTAKEQGILLQQKNAEVLSKSMNDFNAIHNGVINSGQVLYKDMIGMGLTNLGKYGSVFPPDLVSKGKYGLQINTDINQPTIKQNNQQSEIKEPEQKNNPNMVSPIESATSTVSPFLEKMGNVLSNITGGKTPEKKDEK